MAVYLRRKSFSEAVDESSPSAPQVAQTGKRQKKQRKIVETISKATQTDRPQNDPVNRRMRVCSAFFQSQFRLMQIGSSWNPIWRKGDKKLATEDVTERSATDPQYSAHVRTKLAAGIVQTLTLRLDLEELEFL